MRRSRLVGHVGIGQLAPAEVVGGHVRADDRAGDRGPLDDVQHEVEAVAAHAGLATARIVADVCKTDSVPWRCWMPAVWCPFGIARVTPTPHCNGLR